MDIQVSPDGNYTYSGYTKDIMDVLFDMKYVFHIFPSSPLYGLFIGTSLYPSTQRK